MSCVLFAVLLFSPCALRAETARLADGTGMHYETAGSGSVPVVLIHGYAMSWVAWERVIAEFAPRYRLYAVDLRGFGDSDKPEGGYELVRMADDLVEFLDALKIPKAVFVGHSMGGTIAQHIAVRHPGRVLGLVLANSLACNLPPVGISDSVRQRLEGYGTPENNARLLRSGFPSSFDPENISPEEIERFVQIGLKASSAALRETLEDLFTAPAVPGDRFAGLKVPVLIVISTHDRLATFEHAVALSDAIPGAAIRVVTRSGHCPMWERSHEFTRILTEFLQSSLPAAAASN
ncbi:MAG: alpha/beta hydrolase [Desulfobacteraceae bacterium]|nr:alpha/beta hydrolase [Desulfobacteraceae bacterium]